MFELFILWKWLRLVNKAQWLQPVDGLSPSANDWQGKRVLDTAEYDYLTGERNDDQVRQREREREREREKERGIGGGGGGERETDRQTAKRLVVERERERERDLKTARSCLDHSKFSHFSYNSRKPDRKTKLTTWGKARIRTQFLSWLRSSVIRAFEY